MYSFSSSIFVPCVEFLNQTGNPSPKDPAATSELCRRSLELKVANLGHRCSNVGFLVVFIFPPFFFFRDYVSNGPKPALSPEHHNLLETQRAPLLPSFEPQSLCPARCSQEDTERSQKVSSSGLATAEHVVPVPLGRALKYSYFFRVYLILLFPG